MSEATSIAENYIAVWNERSAAARRERLAAQWAGSAAYRDPMTAVEGLDAIDSLISGVQDRFPAFRFALKPGPSGYDGVVRLAWTLGPSGAEAPIEGSDVLVLAGGKIKEVIGFLDKVPQ
jgi:hypothetical protein